LSSRDAVGSGVWPVINEPFSSGICLAGLQSVDGLGELAGAPRAAAQLAEYPPGLELGVRLPPLRS